MRDVPDTTGNAKYDDTGRVEIASHFLYGEPTGKALAITAEVYGLQGYPPSLLVGGVRFRLAEHRAAHNEYIYAAAVPAHAT